MKQIVKAKANRRKANKALTFKPPIRAIARSREKILELKQKKEAVEMVVQGATFEQVSENLGISVKEAYDMVSQTVDKWCTELSLSATQARELDVKRLDALIAYVWPSAQPRPAIDEKTGEIILDKRTNMPVMLPADLSAVKALREIIETRSKLLGTQAATKIEENINLNLRREYVGANPDNL